MFIKLDIKKFCLILLFVFFFENCSKDKDELTRTIENQQDLELVLTYKEAFTALNEGDPYFASKKFLEAELLYPQSKWAAKSALMASYAYYLQNYYAEALSNLERYLKTYPNHRDVAYAHYLIAMCYYETIEDEKRDSAPLFNARNKFNFIVKNFPNSDFALDARFKLDLIENILASKEMYIGRHYIKKKKWIAALNRFKSVVEKFDQTIFVQEALHRLVEINYNLGLIDESERYANVLGYNYQSSEWYKKTYKIFNRDYSIKIDEPIKKDKKSVIDNFKKLFD
tara:strand:- start:576 stop:1427 length:852 start_codon:yes stop_codon:yes gene_type:complete